MTAPTQRALHEALTWMSTWLGPKSADANADGSVALGRLLDAAEDRGRAATTHLRELLQRALPHVRMATSLTSGRQFRETVDLLLHDIDAVVDPDAAAATTGHGVPLYEHWTEDGAPRVLFDGNGKPIRWEITLNEYQRANLLWLLCDLVGYGAGPGVEPFTYANTGDWAGEIPNMLRLNHNEPTEHKPNTSVEEMRKRVEELFVKASEGSAAWYREQLAQVTSRAEKAERQCEELRGDLGRFKEAREHTVETVTFHRSQAAGAVAALAQLTDAVDHMFEHTLPDDVDEGCVEFDVSLTTEHVNDVHRLVQKARAILAAAEDPDALTDRLIAANTSRGTRPIDKPDPRWGEPRTYPSDDRDMEPNELVVQYGGNGDWYVSIRKIGERLGPAVRLTTSGVPRGYHGASLAVARLYRSLPAATS